MKEAWLRVVGLPLHLWTNEIFKRIRDSRRLRKNVVWVNVGDCLPKVLMGILKYCLVGSWKTPLDPSSSASEVEEWVRVAWRLKGNLMMVHLNNDLLFFEFADPEDAKWVFEVGKRSFRGISLQLEWWNPESGCVKRKETMKEAWRRMVGLPLHLWTSKIFKRIGDSQET